jgi:Reverse transcriptase (RNA-dependent DNA polymerase)
VGFLYRVLSNCANSLMIRYADVVTNEKHAFAVYMDQTMSEALKTTEADEWVHGIEREYQNLIEMGTFAEVIAPVGRKLVGTKLILHRKADGRYRPRLVVQGFSQVYGVDYFNTYAPVAGYPVFCLVLAMAASLDLEVRTYDIGNAFVNAPMEEELYVKIPEGYQQYGRQFMDPTKRNEKFNCLRVLKSLYGTKQAASNWYADFSKTFTDLGFKICKHEEGLIFLRKGDIWIIIALWVDDFVYAFMRGSKEALKVIAKLEKYYKLKRTADTLLGLELNISNEKFTLCQMDYIERKAAEFGITDEMKMVYSPMEIGLELVPATVCDDKPYSQLLGSLMHSMTSLRFDIAFAVGILARYANAHDSSHWNAAIRVLRYLYTTRDYCLEFKIGIELSLEGYSDADFGSDSSGKSTTGMLLTLGNCAFLWSSKLQTCVALSTAEAELLLHVTLLFLLCGLETFL